MRVTLASPSLARLAGRFVWLELNYDQPANREFLNRHQVRSTPSLYVLDPRDGQALATHLGATTESELERFLEQGERGYRGLSATAAESALARGDRRLALGQTAGAAAEYRAALQRAVPGWPSRPDAVARLTGLLQGSGAPAEAAAIAMREAPGMARGEAFASVVNAGLAGVDRAGRSATTDSAAHVLEPLAAEAIERRDITRDVRFQLYGELITGAQRRGDSLATERWGTRALAAVDAIRPAGHDEAIALDIVRVELVWDKRSAAHVIPTLVRSERANGDPNTSIRLAQVDDFAGRYDDAIAACRRGLARAEGPVVRTWLLELEAEAWLGRADPGRARVALAEARRSAREIGSATNRALNLRRIDRLLARASTGSRVAR